MIKRSEQALQIQICKYLAVAYPTVLFAHVQNGGTRGGPQAKRIGGIRKAMGVKAGMPDIMLWWSTPQGSKSAAIELKWGEGELSAPQKAMHAQLEANGVPVAVCRSLNEVRLAMQGWGAPSIEYIPTKMPGWGRAKV